MVSEMAFACVWHCLSARTELSCEKMSEIDWKRPRFSVLRSSSPINKHFFFVLNHRWNLGIFRHKSGNPMTFFDCWWLFSVEIDVTRRIFFCICGAITCAQILSLLICWQGLNIFPTERVRFDLILVLCLVLFRLEGIRSNFFFSFISRCSSHSRRRFHSTDFDWKWNEIWSKSECAVNVRYKKMDWIMKNPKNCWNKGFLFGIGEFIKHFSYFALFWALLTV